MIFHRGREMAHQDVGRKKMDRLLKEIMDHAQVEFGPRMEANILLALLAPKKGARLNTGCATGADKRRRPGVKKSVQSVQEDIVKKNKKMKAQDAPRRRQALQDHFHREDHALAFGQAPPARHQEAAPHAPAAE